MNLFKKSYRMYLILVSAIIICAAVVSAIMLWPQCGNGKLEWGETRDSCCLDAGCLGEQSCNQNQCVEPICGECQFLSKHICNSYECCNDSMCERGQVCTNNVCEGIICNDDESFVDFMCKPNLCSVSSDCDDNDITTIDECMGKPKRCMHLLPEKCTDGDGICPGFCTNATDSDCTDGHYTFSHIGYGYRIKYPTQWEKYEDPYYGKLLFDIPNTSITIIIQSFINERNTLNELIDKSKKYFKENKEVAKIISQEPAIFAGQNAYLIDYSISHYFWAYRLKEYIMIKDDIGYFIDIVDYRDEYEKNKQLVDELVRSFEILEYEPELTSPFLWKIEGEQKDSYLYGTMHTSAEVIVEMPVCLFDAINKSDAIYTEIILTNDVSEKRDSVLLPKLKTIEDILPDELYLRVINYSDSFGLEYDDYSRLKIWVLIDYLNSKGVSYSGKILDDYISDLGNDLGKDIGSLEDTAEHVNLFNSLSELDQIEWLEQELDDMEKASKSGFGSATLFEAYLSGDISLIENVTTYENLGFEKTLKTLLLDDRNREMVDRMDEKLQNPTRSNFFAVGVAHYPGETGILRLLEEKGYEISRVNVPECHIVDVKQVCRDEDKLECYVDYAIDFENRSVCDLLEKENATDCKDYYDGKGLLKTEVFLFIEDEVSYDNYDIEVLDINETHAAFKFEEQEFSLAEKEGRIIEDLTVKVIEIDYVGNPDKDTVTITLDT